jgi:alpha-N-arabinofuranosidase
MLKTPTWHVFNQYKHHQGAELLESSLSDAGEYQSEFKGKTRKAPKVTESVSEKDGIITITLNNAMLDEEQEISVSFAEDTDRKVVEATVVTSGDVHDHNTFDAPETVHTEEFKAYQEGGRSLTLTLPKASVVMLRVK